MECQGPELSCPIARKPSALLFLPPHFWTSTGCPQCYVAQYASDAFVPKGLPCGLSWHCCAKAGQFVLQGPHMVHLLSTLPFCGPPGLTPPTPSITVCSHHVALLSCCRIPASRTQAGGASRMRCHGRCSLTAACTGAGWCQGLTPVPEPSAHTCHLGFVVVNTHAVVHQTSCYSCCCCASSVFVLQVLLLCWSCRPKSRFAGLF